MRPLDPLPDPYPPLPTETWPCPVDPTSPPAPPPGFTRPADRYPFLVATKIVDLFTDPGDHIIDVSARAARSPAEAAAVAVAAALAGRRCTATPRRHLAADAHRHALDALPRDRHNLLSWRRGTEATLNCDLADLLITDDTRWPRRPLRRRLDRAVDQLATAKCLLAADGHGALMLRLGPLVSDYHTHMSIALTAAHDAGLASFVQVIAVPNPTRRTSVDATGHLASRHGRRRWGADPAGDVVDLLVFTETADRA